MKQELKTLNSHRFKVAQGLTALESSKVERLRERWKQQGYDVPPMEQSSSVVRGRQYTNKTRAKPGTELTELIGRWFGALKSENATCSCRTVAAEMDQHGTDWCRRKRDGYIVPAMLSNREQLSAELKKQNGWKSWIAMATDQVPDVVLQTGAAAMVGVAIDRAEKKAAAARKAQMKSRAARRPMPAGLSNEPLGMEYTVTPDKTAGNETRSPVQLFERVVCISLNRRPDRWKQFEESIEACGWPFNAPVREPAVDGRRVPPPKCWRISEGAWGCYRSHIRICEDALSDGVSSVLFMEDDAKPVAGFGDRVAEWLQYVPDNWQGLYFGGEHVGGKSKAKSVNRHVRKCNYVTRTHCFGIRQPLLTEYYRFLVDFEMQQKNVSQHVDHAIGRFMRTGNHAIYCPENWMVAQAAATSDIFNRAEKERMFR